MKWIVTENENQLPSGRSLASARTRGRVRADARVRPEGGLVFIFRRYSFHSPQSFFKRIKKFSFPPILPLHFFNSFFMFPISPCLSLSIFTFSLLILFLILLPSHCLSSFVLCFLFNVFEFSFPLILPFQLFFDTPRMSQIGWTYVWFHFKYFLILLGWVKLGRHMCSSILNISWYT